MPNLSAFLRFTRFSYFLCVFVVKNVLDMDIATTAAAYVGNVGGGITGAIRCKCANSVASAGLPAGTKCQFSASLPCSRQSFRRIKCKICTTCESCAHFA